MTELNFQTNEPRYVDTAIAVYNQVNPGIPFASWFTRQVQQMVDSWRDSTEIDKVTVGAFIARNPQAYARLIAQVDSDPVLGQLAHRLATETHVWVYSTEVQQGFAYLVATGKLTVEEAASFLTSTRPTLVEPT